MKSGEVWHVYMSVKVSPRSCRCPYNAAHQPRSVEALERRRVVHELTGRAFGALLPALTAALLGRTRLRADDQPASSRQPDSPAAEAAPTTLQGTTDADSVLVAQARVGAPREPCPAFPTEARERAKIKEKAGHKAKKRLIPVEHHHDDLGDDLTGLGGDLDAHAADVLIAEQERDTPHEQMSIMMSDPVIQPRGNVDAAHSRRKADIHALLHLSLIPI